MGQTGHYRTMPNRRVTYELITPSLRTVKECQLINELSENMPSTPRVYVTIMPKNEPHVSTMPTRMVTYEPITPSLRTGNKCQLILSMIYEPIKNVPSKTAMNVPKKYAKNKTIMPMK